MAKIDVTTTQKVTIQYETAGFVWRFIAWLVDTSIIAIFFITVIYFIFSSKTIFGSTTASATVAGILILIKYFYSLVIEVFTNGQSIGKKIVGICVIKLNGNALETNDYLIRWAYRAIDFGMSAFAIGTISILMSEKNQRLGDMIANTTVIRLKPDRIVTLEDLENLPDKEDYVPKYPQVTRYNDAEMLALKNLLFRYQQYRNKTYANILQQTVKKIKEQMDVEEIRIDDVSFLREIISEYVILTR
ncbi:MAG: hypothetical protein JWN78_17 [Bacteroidota bacterium]|nr:hypothetical protein [Bacteroidota bacterium]